MRRRVDLEKLTALLKENPRATTKSLAPLVGASETAVGRWRRRLGYPAPHLSNKVLDDAEFAQVVKDNPTLTLAELAERFGVRPRTISRAKRRVNLTDEEHSRRVIEAFATVEERIQKGLEMLEDGAPLAEVERTLHLHSETLQRRHPEQRGWTPKQTAEHAAAIRRANRMERRAIPQRWSAA